jgi:hypothetical protein
MFHVDCGEKWGIKNQDREFYTLEFPRCLKVKCDVL